MDQSLPNQSRVSWQGRALRDFRALCPQGQAQPIVFRKLFLAQITHGRLREQRKSNIGVFMINASKPMNGSSVDSIFFLIERVEGGAWKCPTMI